MTVVVAALAHVVICIGVVGGVHVAAAAATVVVVVALMKGMIGPYIPCMW